MFGRAVAPVSLSLVALGGRFIDTRPSAMTTRGAFSATTGASSTSSTATTSAGSTTVDPMPGCEPLDETDSSQDPQEWTSQTSQWDWSEVAGDEWVCGVD